MPSVEVAEETPIYIVNFPRDDPEALLAESKFRKAIDGLRRVYPNITEARATVKVSETPNDIKRYEVRALVQLPGHIFDFTAEGWSLAEAFDEISSKVKRLRTKPEKKQSYRRQPTRAEIESAVL